MTNIFFSIMLILLSIAHSEAQDIHQINQEKNRLQREGMYLLTSWAAVNIAGGTAGYFLAKDREWKYFHEMNVFWNTVNMGLGIAGILSERKSRQDLSLTESIRAQKKIERIFLINSGLDLLYIGGGIAMKSFQNANNRDKMTGYGNSLIMQGSFLLVFDAMEYFLHRSNGQRFKNKNLGITCTGSGLRLVYNLSGNQNSSKKSFR
jgi:hypothetical protein